MFLFNVLVKLVDQSFRLLDEFYLLARIILQTRFLSMDSNIFCTAYQGPILKKEADAFPPQRFYPQLTQKVALRTDPKRFLKASSVPIYTKFEEGALAQKRDFWLKLSKKSLQHLFWPVFFKFCLQCKKIDQNGVLSVLWEGKCDRV